ncbi:MAG TPA: citrate synthase [Candidatus Dormibacteraeota bacterium]|nr:citrate synthase [Candidatus Dormibacteraeota bacterium]
MADTLTITDNRTGRSIEVPIEHGAIRATALSQLRAGADDHNGILSYDPAFINTASCASRITFIDGERGVLLYRGYPIEELAERSTFLEVAYLLVHGDLPTERELAEWTHEITMHTMVHENVKRFMDGFHHDAHPMGMLVGTVGALSTFYPEAHRIHDPAQRRISIYRLIAKMPTVAAYTYRHSKGLPYIHPDNDLGYAANFLSMMFRMVERRYSAVPEIVRALDVLFILHADHEQNCSTNAMRSVGSSQPDPYSCTAAAIAALYGPLHGGANEEVLRMLERIRTVDAIPEFIAGVKAGRERLMGFGHRVYKNYDPRAAVIKRMADQVFAVTGINPLLGIALELERIALEDEYFITRRLYPNVDFYSGLIYQALNIPVDMFPVLFAIPRTAGWLAQWEEGLLDREQRIARPRQVYLGSPRRSYVVPGERAMPQEVGAR